MPGITWANASRASGPDACSRVTFEIETYEDIVRLTVTHDEPEAGRPLDVFAKPKAA